MALGGAAEEQTDRARRAELCDADRRIYFSTSVARSSLALRGVFCSDGARPGGGPEAAQVLHSYTGARERHAWMDRS